MAEQQHVTESVLLKRLVESVLFAFGTPTTRVVEPIDSVARDTRVFVRLRPEDYVLLRERATSRDMATATYASVVLRTHLRRVVLIPDRELLELKRSVAELGAIGRNLNQMARMGSQPGRLAGPGGQELLALLRACAGLREYVKNLIRANIASWETGHVETSDR